MKIRFAQKIVIFLCTICLCLSVCACSGSGGAKALSLPDGWIVDREADQAAALKGLSGESVSLGEAFAEGSAWFYNRFSSNLSVAGGEKAILRLYDAQGITGAWLNGKELSLQDEYLDVTGKISGKNQLLLRGEGEFSAPGSKVTLEAHPAVFVLGARTEWSEDGKATAFVTLENLSGKDAAVELSALLSSADDSFAVSQADLSVSAPAGRSEHAVALSVNDAILWHSGNSYLYDLSIIAQSSLGRDEYRDLTGLKRLAREESGFFSLNGQPTLLKVAELTRKEALGDCDSLLSYLKTVGFNAVLVAAGAPTERVLERCDKLGLMAFANGGQTVAQKSHISLISLAESDIALSASHREELAGIAAGSLVRVSADAAETYSVRAEDLVAWLSDQAIDTTPADAEPDALDAQTDHLGALLTAARRFDVAGVVAATDFSRVKADFTEVIRDNLSDIRFVITADRTELYSGETLNFQVALANFHQIRTADFYTVRVTVTGNGKSYSRNLSFSLDGNQHLTPLLSDSVSLSGYPAGDYVISCEMTYGGHPDCGALAFRVADRSALPALSGTVYAAGLTSYQSALLSSRGASVAPFTGSESGRIVLGPGADEGLLEKAKALAEAGSQVVVLDAYRYASLPVGKAAAPDLTFVSQEVSGLTYAGKALNEGICGDLLETVFEGEIRQNLLPGIRGAADGSGSAVTGCGVFALGSGSMALSGLRSLDGSPLSDALLCSLLLLS